MINCCVPCVFAGDRLSVVSSVSAHQHSAAGAQTPSFAQLQLRALFGFGFTQHPHGSRGSRGSHGSHGSHRHASLGSSIRGGGGGIIARGRTETLKSKLEHPIEAEADVSPQLPLLETPLSPPPPTPLWQSPNLRDSGKGEIEPGEGELRPLGIGMGMGMGVGVGMGMGMGMEEGLGDELGFAGNLNAEMGTAAAHVGIQIRRPVSLTTVRYSIDSVGSFSYNTSLGSHPASPIVNMLTTTTTTLNTRPILSPLPY